MTDRIDQAIGEGNVKPTNKSHSSQLLQFELGLALLTLTTCLLLVILIVVLCRRRRSQRTNSRHAIEDAVEHGCGKQDEQTRLLAAKLSGDEDDEFTIPVLSKDGRWIDAKFAIGDERGESPLVSPTRVKPERVVVVTEATTTNPVVHAHHHQADDHQAKESESTTTASPSVVTSATYRFGKGGGLLKMDKSVLSGTPPRHQRSQDETARQTTTSDEDLRQNSAASLAKKSTMGRRTSSTPNLQLLASKGRRPRKLIDKKPKKTALDDSALFPSDSSGQPDFRLDSHDNQADRSGGDSRQQPVFLRLPDPTNTTQADGAERGLLVFALTINQRDPNDDRHGLDVLLHVFQAHSVLTGYSDPRRGKFYIKARIQRSGTNSALSTLSLNQLHSHKSHGLHIGGHASKSNLLSSGSTPIQLAFRSPVFRENIKLELPIDVELPNLVDEIDDDHSIPPYELRLDLKERKGLLQPSSQAHFSLWNTSRSLGSVILPLTNRLLAYFVDSSKEKTEGLGSCKEESPVNDSKEESEEDSVLSNNPLDNQVKTLRFVRELHLLDGSGQLCELTFGLHYRPDNNELTLSPLKCTGLSPPKGTKSVFIRAALMTNHHLMDTQQSNQSVRLTLNSAEFALHEKVLFVLSKDTNNNQAAPIQLERSCLIVSLWARTGNHRSESSNCLLGRCVTGSNGLAYGHGLYHWKQMQARRGYLVNHTHVLI